MSVLYYENQMLPVSLAIIGYSFEDDGRVVVSQIQSTPTCYGRQSSFLPHHWEIALLESVAGWAHDEGFEEIGIARAESLISFGHCQTVLPRESLQYYQFLAEHQSRMKRRYNGLARRMHFKYDERRECFVKKLV